MRESHRDAHLNRTRRHLVYVHSKMTILDDAVLVCGSANINQRSLDGNRDSELLMGAWQPDHLATKERIGNGDVSMPEDSEEAFRLFRQVRQFARLEPVTGAYEAMVSSGDLRLLRSQELRSELAAFAGEAGDAPDPHRR